MEAILTRVVLPAPFRPTKACIFPLSTFRLMSDKTVWGPSLRLLRLPAKDRQTCERARAGLSSPPACGYPQLSRLLMLECLMKSIKIKCRFRALCLQIHAHPDRERNQDRTNAVRSTTRDAS